MAYEKKQVNLFRFYKMLCIALLKKKEKDNTLLMLWKYDSITRTFEIPLKKVIVKDHLVNSIIFDKMREYNALTLSLETTWRKENDY